MRVADAPDVFDKARLLSVVTDLSRRWRMCTITVLLEPGIKSSFHTARTGPPRLPRCWRCSTRYSKMEYLMGEAHWRTVHHYGTSIAVDLQAVELMIGDSATRAGYRSWCSGEAGACTRAMSSRTETA